MYACMHPGFHPPADRQIDGQIAERKSLNTRENLESDLSFLILKTNIYMMRLLDYLSQFELILLYFPPCLVSYGFVDDRNEFFLPLLF
jgi:hypothetical protein